MLLGGRRSAKGVVVRKSLSQIKRTRDIKTAWVGGVSVSGACGCWMGGGDERMRWRRGWRGW